MVFSIENKANMILVYGEAERNSARSALLYVESYPTHCHPSHQTFENRTTGNLAICKSE
jgi:hypothetical protein